MGNQAKIEHIRFDTQQHRKTPATHWPFFCGFWLIFLVFHQNYFRNGFNRKEFKLFREVGFKVLILSVYFKKSEFRYFGVYQARLPLFHPQSKNLTNRNIFAFKHFEYFFEYLFFFRYWNWLNFIFVVLVCFVQIIFLFCRDIQAK